MEYTTLLGRKKKGLCSNFISELTNCELCENEILPFDIKFGSFPKIQLTDSILLIATGTGIAPLRSLLWERHVISSTHNSELESTSGRTVLFYGCRNKSKDFLYSEEFQIFEQNKKMNFSINVAFSRDQEDKVYVQHLMKEQAKFINDLLTNDKCYIILVGNSKVLPKSIDNTIKQILMSERNLSEEEAIKYVMNLKKIGRYFIETW